MGKIEKPYYDDGNNGHLPLHALKNTPTDYFSDVPEEEIDRPKPDSTPTSYISESPGAFSVLPTTFGPKEQTLRQRIFIDTSKLSFEDSAETLILGNRDLPAFEKHQEFESLMKDDNTKVIVVSGPTGSGKSTQFPQYSVNAGYEAAKITQPRRAAADNVSNRIKQEIISVTNDSPDRPTVGLRTGGKKEGPRDATVTVLTEGFVLADWQTTEDLAKNDKKIALFLDEAHESSSDMEILMALVKQLFIKYPDCKLKLIIMSATMNSQFYADYYDDLPSSVTALLEVEGRMFDVTKYERPKSDIKLEAIKAARSLAKRNNPDDPNGIWVFVPGKREIKDAIDEITTRLPDDIASQVVVLPFHAKLTEAEQQAAFQRYPGVKVIVSTNAGETSITDPHCAYVIDSGLARQMLLDEEQVTGLERYHISKDECTQRAGRTGRVCPGIYVLTRLDNEEEFVTFNARNQSPIPEILRTDIVRHVLRTASFGYNIELLTEIPHPISHEVLSRAKNILQMLGAFDEHYNLTHLGLRMNEFPASATSARMMVEADRYNQNIKNYMSAIVASLEAGKLQYYAPDVERRWQDLTEETTSDLLAQLDIFIAIQGMSETEMREYDIDVNNYRRALEQYHKIVQRSGSTNKNELKPATPAEKEDIISCILAGSVHSIYLSNGPATYRQLGSKTIEREISNRSLVKSHPPIVVGDPYRAEYWRGGERREKHLIENVTKTTLSEIGHTAVHLSTWEHESYILRDNSVVSRRAQKLFGQNLGLYEEAPATPSSELRKYLIDYTLSNPGPNQKKLRKIKKETALLALRAGKHVEQLSQAQLEEYINLAVTDELTDLSQIDNNLRLIMEEKAVSLDAYVSPKRRAEIVRNSPLEIEVKGSILQIAYKTSGPEIRMKNKYDLSAALTLEEDITLEDGRTVCFTYEGKKYALHQLQEAFGKKHPRR